MMTFQKNLLDWYYREHRQLPWRESHEPYRIWLSEIMCQQTQVATVIPYYLRFLERFPTVFDLALAGEDEVYKLWEGLGYYSRAKRLILCARMIVETYEGVFPKTYKELVKLPGIGPYTAGALLSIAYNIKEPAIDGNVMRVYSRLYQIETDVGKPGAAKAFDPFVRQDLPEDVRHFNQALMELGARICTPTKPLCEKCPIQEACLAKAKNLQTTLPVKAPKPKKKHQTIGVILVEHKGKYMLEKRGTQGLLANLWGLPTVKLDKGFDDGLIRDTLLENYGLTATFDAEIVKKKHVFTHLIWDMTLYRYTIKERIHIDEPETAWVHLEGVSDYPLPTAFLKLLS